MKVLKSRYLLFFCLVALAVAYQFFDLSAFLTLEYVQLHHQALQNYAEENPWQTGLFFFGIYILFAALSIPGCTVLTLVGGALFGTLLGTLLVSFASTLGASLALLTARFLFREWIQKYFATTLNALNKGLKQEGVFYLLSLRLIPVFPFFAINLAMGLTEIRVSTFYWVSQFGMLPGTLLYVNAGTQLGRIHNIKDILSPIVLISLLLVGLFPLLVKSLLKKRRA